MGDGTYDFTGKKAIVTGASKGIGREIALRLAAAGADLGITARNTGELASLVGEIAKTGRTAIAEDADLADRDATLEMAKSLCESLGRVDILINNAGTTYPESIVDLDPEHWDITMAVNLRAPALVTKIVAAGMIERRDGVIVNISSQAGLVALTEHAAYCASKFALHGLTKVLALELGPYGIRVNAVAPTVTLTPMGLKVWGDPAKAEPMLARIPLGRFA